MGLLAAQRRAESATDMPGSRRCDRCIYAGSAVFRGPSDVARQRRVLQRGDGGAGIARAHEIPPRRRQVAQQAPPRAYRLV